MKNVNSSVIPAVILGMSANGLSVARSLGRKGIPVVGLDNDKNAPGMRSRYLSEALITPNVIHDEIAFVRFLKQLAERLQSQPVLFPTADEYVLCLSRNRAELESYYRFLIPSHNIIDAFLDKEKSYHLARMHAVTHPATFSIKTSADIEDADKNLRFPCIIKPIHAHLWREQMKDNKTIYVDSLTELREQYGQIAPTGLEIILQEIIPGADTNLYELMVYCDKNSNPKASFCCRKLRQYPPHFGIGSFVESVKKTDIFDLGADFLKRIQYKGIVEFEYKYDERSQRYFFIEANVRTSFIGELSIAAGVDIPYLYYQDVAGFSAHEAHQYKEGVKLVNFELDIASFWRYRRIHEITFFEWLRSFRGKVVHTYFAWDDVLPFLFVFFRFTKMIIRKLLLINKKENS